MKTVSLFKQHISQLSKIKPLINFLLVMLYNNTCFTHKQPKNNVSRILLDVSIEKEKNKLDFCETPPAVSFIPDWPAASVANIFIYFRLHFFLIKNTRMSLYTFRKACIKIDIMLDNTQKQDGRHHVIDYFALASKIYRKIILIIQ